MKKILCAALTLLLLVTAACEERGPANTVNSIEDAQGKVIGVLAGTSSTPYAVTLGETHVYSTSPQLMDALKSGALDCVVMEGGPGDRLAKRTSGVKVLTSLLEYDLCFAIAKENPELTSDVNAALRQLRDNGTLWGIFDKYVNGGSYSYTPSLPESPNVTLTLAVPGEYPPYSYKNAEGELEGLDVDVARAVCAVLGVGLKITEADMDKLVTTVQFGKVDFALGGVHDNDADRELVDFSTSYAQLVQVLIVRK